jgi:hypothetical protein
VPEGGGWYVCEKDGDDYYHTDNVCYPTGSDARMAAQQLYAQARREHDRKLLDNFSGDKRAELAEALDQARAMWELRSPEQARHTLYQRAGQAHWTAVDAWIEAERKAARSLQARRE